MKIQYARLAHDDLLSLLEFIAKEDPIAAQKIAQSLHSSIDRLASFPFYGRIGDVSKTRQFVVSGLPYIVIYQVCDETIRILRIYHSSQNRPEA